MRLVPVTAVCAGALILSTACPAGAAAPLEVDHYSFEESDTFTDTECGEPITIDVHVEGSGVFMFKSGRAGGPPLVFDNYEFTESFTNVDTGETATVYHQGLYKDLNAVHVEGTVYEFTAIEVGRPVVVFGPDGKRLVFDRGQLRHTFRVDTHGDDDLSNDDFLGEDEPRIAGPHPVFEEEVDFCDLLDVLR
jgi:hypothetical protein